MLPELQPQVIVVDRQEMMERNKIKEIDVVKYDLNFAKNSYQNRFDNELQNKSIEMYALIELRFN